MDYGKTFTDERDRSKNQKPADLPDIDRQIRNGKVVLRELRDMLEDLDDRRELARAKKRNGEKSRYGLVIGQKGAEL